MTKKQSAWIVLRFESVDAFQRFDLNDVYTGSSYHGYGKRIRMRIGDQNRAFVDRSADETVVATDLG